jgi:maltose O-acetyltransferase
MTKRVFLGSTLAYLYNDWLANLPSRRFRGLYLSRWFGSFGSGANVQMGCRFLNGRKIFVGDRSVINFGCLLDGRKYAIRIGSDVSVGPNASLLTLGHDPQSSAFEDKGADIEVGDHAWVGYGAVVLPGVSIGEGAVVGAGAVVTRDVEPWTIVAGNPARKVNERRQCDYTLDYHPWLV